MRTSLFAPLLAVFALAACEPTSSGTSASSPPSAGNESAPSATAAGDATASESATATPAVGPSNAGGSSQPAVLASNALAFDLYRQLGAGGGNLAYSPASISIALAMTYAGANGNTAKQMRAALSLPEAAAELHGGWASVVNGWLAANDVEVAVANRLYADKSYTLEAPFLKLTKSHYGAPVSAVDFAGAPQAQRKRINDWVAKQTRDRIEELIPPKGVTPDTRMALVNAIYFKSKWASPFSSARTQQAAFATPAGAVDVPMMAQTGRMSYAEVDGAKLAERSYANSQFAALFVLPSDAGGLPQLEKKLDGKRFATWTTALRKQQVSMKLPRFQIKPKEAVELSRNLKQLGMTDAFDGNKADFTGITNPADADDRLFVEEVYHKTFVAMNEAGTEAAAATAVMMGRSGGKPTAIKEFHADRPFLFFIRDLKTGLVMFAGRVVDPAV